MTIPCFNYRCIDLTPKTPEKPSDLERIDKLQDKLYESEPNMTGEELIGLLKEIPALGDYFEMLSGVGEGYTVEQQTLMALQIFEQEFSHLSKEYQDRLDMDMCLFGDSCQLSSGDKRIFLLLLALCNIGKGLNFFQGRGGDKEEELLTTREVITQKSEWLGLNHYTLRTMMGLLKSDVVGDFLKKPYSQTSLESALEKICAIANEVDLKPESVLNRLVLLHQITASRYDIVRKSCFKTEEGVFINANGIELPKLKRDHEAKSSEEFLDSAYCEDYQEKLRALRRFVSLDAKKMIRGQQEFSPKDLVDVISRNDELRCAYGKSAGVGEGYTVKQHTLMVLDVFTKELQTRHTHDVLAKTGLTKEAFCFFLALHDIGKGVALETTRSKSVELETTRNLINKYAAKLGLDQYLPVFDALLKSDVLGDYLKKRNVSEEDCALFTDKFLEVAYDAKVPIKAFFELFVLFHQCDASSYPFVRERFFSNNAEVKVSIGHMNNLNALEGEGDLVYSVSNREKMKTLRDYIDQKTPYDGKARMVEVSSFDLENPQNISLKDLEQLIAIRRLWKFNMALAEIDRKKDVHYQQFRGQFKKVLNYKLPTRLIQALKLNRTYGTFRSQIMFNGKLRRKEGMTDKTYLRDLLPKLMELAKKDEELLRVLEKITVLHGSNSASLAMMLLSNQPQLVCAGDLLRNGIAPMSGELSDGFSAWGINQRALSAENVANFGRSIGYTQSEFHYDHTKNINRFSNPDLDALLKEEKWDQTSVYLLQLRQWDDEAFKRLINVNQYLDCLEVHRKKAVKPLETLLQITRHEFTDEERELIKNSQLPEGLHFVLSALNEREAQYIFKFGSFKSEDLENKIYRCRANGDSFCSLIYRMIAITMNSQDVEKDVQIISKELEKIEARYRLLRDILTSEKPKMSISPDNLMMRKMIEQPVPVLFASTTYIPTEISNHSEFLITEATKLGKEGFDLIFTDSEGSRQQILEMLPENLREEMTVSLFEKVFKKLPFPIYHNPNQVRSAK